MKVRLIVTVDVDPEKWDREYGTPCVNGELWSYFREELDSAVHTSGARHTVKDVVIR